MKKAISILLVCVLVLALAACGGTPANESGTGGTAATPAPASGGNSGSNATPAPESGPSEAEDPYAGIEKEVVVGISADPATFYPWGAFGQGTRHIFPMLYQTLLSDVRDPETGKITYYHTLMDSYEQTGDTTYVVTLREGIYDTDGNPFTASDVKFCIDSFKQGPAASNLGNVESCSVIDDLNVEITVSAILGVGEFEEILTIPNMVTQAAFEASPDEMATTPVGTTGYYVDEYVPGSYVVMKKADSYWNQKANETHEIEDGYLPTSDNTKIDVARFEVITDTSTMALALETGDIDIATAISTTDIPLYQNDDDYTVHQYPDNMFGLVFNSSENSEFQNINLRKALAYSISAQDLLDMIYDGDGFILHAFGMNYQMGYVDKWDSEDYFSQDMAKAKEYFDAYLEESGKSASDLSLTIAIMGTDAMQKYAQVVQGAMIALTGNNNVLSIEQYDSATYTSVRNDPAQGWDLAILNAMTNKTYILSNWTMNYNGYSRVQKNDLSGSGDTKLWDLITAAQTPDTYGPETADAAQKYMNEQCYLVNYICGPAYWVGSNLVTQYALGAKNSVALTAMDYDWSVKY